MIVFFGWRFLFSSLSPICYRKKTSEKYLCLCVCYLCERCGLSLKRSLIKRRMLSYVQMNGIHRLIRIGQRKRQRGCFHSYESCVRHQHSLDNIFDECAFACCQQMTHIHQKEKRMLSFFIRWIRSYFVNWYSYSESRKKKRIKFS